MKKQQDYTFIPDWQVLKYSGNELDNYPETDGIEEEQEFNFFNLELSDIKDQQAHLKNR